MRSSSSSRRSSSPSATCRWRRVRSSHCRTRVQPTKPLPSFLSEKFDQAISDYTAGLQLKEDLLPLSSRQIAEAHYKLSIVLDLTSGRLGDSITHAERALDSVEARLAELRDALSGQGLVKPEPTEAGSKGKGKGKATGPTLPGDDAVSLLTKSQMEAEEKELQGLREDLALKVCSRTHSQARLLTTRIRSRSSRRRPTNQKSLPPHLLRRRLIRSSTLMHHQLQRR